MTSLGKNQFDDNAELSKENLSLRIPAEFKSATHAIAVNEHRNNFHVRSIYSSAASANQINGKVLPNGKVRIEKGFMGAHADIGGGYSEGDLSDVSLMWIIGEAKKAGVRFNQNTIKAGKWDSIENPIVHDSVGVSPAGTSVPKRYLPERVVAWAADAKGPSMFDSPEHLELVWSETLKFQNADEGGKFQKAHDLVQAIIKEREELLCEEEMRDALALIKEFKSPENCCDVVEITLKSSVPARSGIAGPQTEFGKVYAGGARQYELLMNTKYTDLVEQTFEIKRLYRL